MIRTTAMMFCKSSKANSLRRSVFVESRGESLVFSSKDTLEFRREARLVQNLPQPSPEPPPLESSMSDISTLFAAMQVWEMSWQPSPSLASSSRLQHCGLCIHSTVSRSNYGCVLVSPCRFSWHPF